MEIEGENLLEVEAIDIDVTIPAELPNEAADVIILDDEELSFPGDYPEAVSTPKIKAVIGGHKSMLISSEEAGHRRNGGEPTSS